MIITFFLLILEIVLFLIGVWFMLWMLHLDGIYKELKVQSKIMALMAEKQGISKTEIDEIIKKTTV